MKLSILSKTALSIVVFAAFAFAAPPQNTQQNNQNNRNTKDQRTMDTTHRSMKNDTAINRNRQKSIYNDTVPNHQTPSMDTLNRRSR